MAKSNAIAVAIVVVLEMLGLLLPRASMTMPARPVNSRGDAETFAAIIERLEAGEPYYDAVGAELRAGHYPTLSVFNWRTPLYHQFVAAVSPKVTGLLLSALVIITVICAVQPLGIPSALMLLVASLPMTVPIAALFSESAAGVLIAASLVAQTRRSWVLGAFCGVLAVFVRELAAGYAVTAGGLAALAGRRKEGLVWAAGGLVYLVYYALHLDAARSAMLPGDLPAPSWLAWGGWGFVLSTAAFSGLFTALPVGAVALLVPIAVAGVFVKTWPAAGRVSLVVYAVAFCIVGLPFNAYWGGVTAPLWALALGAMLPLTTTWLARHCRKVLVSPPPSSDAGRRADCECRPGRRGP